MRSTTKNLMEIRQCRSQTVDVWLGTSPARTLWLQVISPVQFWSRNSCLRRRNIEVSQVRPIAYFDAFVPIAIETFCAFGEEAAKFMSELGRRLTKTTQDSRSASFLFQRLTVTKQRGNAACVLWTIPVGCSIDSFSSI